jgi:hypothetical protein
MVGLIWFVQLVHYPLFGSVGADHFADYERQHMRRTGWAVGLFMPAEAVTGVWLVVTPPVGVSTALTLAGLALLVVIWISTAVFQAPTHFRLAKGYDAVVGRRLVLTNWIRTVAWKARGVLVLFMTYQALD